MKKFLLLLVLILVSTAAYGQVFHEVKADTGKSQINTTVVLECDPETSSCPVNSWKLEWTMPENAEVKKIRDTLGEITDYTVTGKKIQIRTNSGERRKTETVEIAMVIERDAEEIYKGLYKREFSLAGLAKSQSSGYVKAPGLISGWIGYGSKPVFYDSNMSFATEGSTAVRVNFGQGNKSKYYEYFGIPARNSESVYEISVGMTGLVQDFQRFPVAVMAQEDYNETVVDWSSGEYIGGSFRMRKGLDERFKPVLAHETVHGLNDRALKWDSTSTSWFDEGSAKFVEFLVQRKLYNEEKTDRPPAELFGKEKRYDPDPSDDTYYTLPPEGDREKLWNYYENDREFMKDWNPMQNSENRDFGYAYSELMVRNYVARMNGSLREIYPRVDPGRQVKSPEQKWEIFSQELDTTPCKYENRQKFESCLQEVNNHDYKILRAQNPQSGQDQIKIQPIEVPNRTEQFSSGNTFIPQNLDTQKIRTGIEQLLYRLNRVLNSLIENSDIEVEGSK